MTADKLLKCIEATVKRLGGSEDKGYHRPQFTVFTRYGPLQITPFHSDRSPWIALRFLTHHTGKVNDTLCGAGFNGYSGKWNISPSQEGADKNETGRHRLREHCLQEFLRRMDCVKVETGNVKILERPT